MILWEDCKHIGSPAGLKISFYIFKDTSGFLPEIIKQNQRKITMHTEQDKIVYLILFLVDDVILCSEVSTTLMS